MRRKKVMYICILVFFIGDLLYYLDEFLIVVKNNFSIIYSKKEGSVFFVNYI